MSQDMSDVAASKVIQTEVDGDLYERFAAAADARDLTLKAAARDAIAAYADRHQPVDPDDPIFAPLEWDDDGDRTDDASERIDDVVYGSDPDARDR